MAVLGDLVVKIRADIKDLQSKMAKAADKVKQSQDKIKKSTAGTSKRIGAFQHRFSNAATAVAALQGPLGPLAGRIRSVGALFGSAGFLVGAFALAIAGLVAAFRSLAMAASRAEQAQAKFNALVKSTNMAAGQTSEGLERMARDMAKDTLFSVTQMRDAMGVMLTFKDVAGDSFGRAMSVATDMSQVLGTDVKSSVLQLGKALEAPEIGLSMLRRSGISFTQDQKDLITSLARTGQKGEALNMILAQIEGQLGGTAKAAAGTGGKVTLAGAFDELTRKIGLFMEQLFEGTEIMSKFAEFVMKLANMIPALDLSGMNFSELAAGLNNANVELSVLNAKIKELESRDTNIFTKGGVDAQIAALKKQAKEQEELINKFKEEIAIREKAEAANAKATAKTNEVIIEQSQAYKDAKKKLKDMSNAMQSKTKTLGVYGADLKILNLQEKLLNEERKKSPNLSKEMEKAIRDLVEAQREQIEEQERMAEAFGHIEKAVNTAFSTMENSIVDLIRGTKSLKDVMKTIMQQFIADITTSIMKMLILDRLKEQIMGAVGKSTQSGAIGNILGSIFGSRATGGSVGSKSPYMVGEKGPELFIPNTSGRVAPLNKAQTGLEMGGKSPIVVEQHINFSTGIQSTVRSEVLNLLPQIQNSTIAAVQEARMRGGKFAESFGG